MGIKKAIVDFLFDASNRQEKEESALKKSFFYKESLIYFGERIKEASDPESEIRKIERELNKESVDEGYYQKGDEQFQTKALAFRTIQRIYDETDGSAEEIDKAINQELQLTSGGSVSQTLKSAQIDSKEDISQKIALNKETGHSR